MGNETAGAGWFQYLSLRTIGHQEKRGREQLGRLPNEAAELENAGKDYSMVFRSLYLGAKGEPANTVTHWQYCFVYRWPSCATSIWRRIRFKACLHRQQIGLDAAAQAAMVAAGLLQAAGDIRFWGRSSRHLVLIHILPSLALFPGGHQFFEGDRMNLTGAMLGAGRHCFLWRDRSYQTARRR
jgi:hypothetical protein